MKYSEFKLNEFVKKESNIWACIYRSVNRKKDNIDYDEEDEGYHQLLANSFKLAESQIFKDFTYRRKNQLSNLLRPHKLVLKGFPQSEEVDEENNENSEYYSKISENNLKEKIALENDKDQGSILFHKRGKPSMARLKTQLVGPFEMKKSSQEGIQTEEMLVIYYVATLIRLSKFSDALKAINEYKKKDNLSKQAQAHMYKIFGVLTMMNEEKDYYKAKKYFKKSIEKFIDLNCVRGNAIAHLAWLRCE